jgi:hypothetical protein
MEEAMQRQFAPRVFQLGYIALETPDILRAKDHYAETIGMSETATVMMANAICLSAMSTTTSFFARPSRRRWAISASSSSPAPS